MNRLIGITGGMSSGKTTISHGILKYNPDYIYVDVDIFRRSLYENDSYVLELKNAIPELKKYGKIDSIILNKYIYSNEVYMKRYKDILYKYLFNYLDSFDNKTIIVDWALMLNDDLKDMFDKIIYVTASDSVRLERLSTSDLSKEDILRRFELQRIDDLGQYFSDSFLVINTDNGYDLDRISEFLNGMECKFTLPNNEGKAIWEITHQCNYNCSYCIFSCNSKKINGELTTLECYHIIDELVLHNFKHLKITGGEPFIRKDILEILKYASERLITDISTNASLITTKKLELLNQLKLKMIHVSLDGDRLEHESVRGRDTYERTIRGLKILRNSVNKVRIGSVIHKENQYDLESLVLDSVGLEADEIIFSIMEPVAGQDRTLVKTVPNDVLIYQIEELRKKYNGQITVNYNFGKQPNYVSRCPAGDKFLYINNFGNVSPCPWVLEGDKSCISAKSLRDNSLDEIKQDKALVKFLDAKRKGKCYGKI